MAEAVVSSVIERLGDLLISEASFLYGVSGEIAEIQRELQRMQNFLSEADKKQISDKRVRGWVAEIRELAFKTEDVIETFAFNVAADKEKSGLKEMLRRFACFAREGARLHKTGTEIQAIRGQLSGLTASLTTYGITKGLEEGETSNSLNLKNHRMFYPHNVGKDFVGMKKEMEEVISHLKKEDQGCEVVSICGMGGQGKTTMATQLYNHIQLKAHFEAFGWVCITQQFDRVKVLKSILEQLVPAGRRAEVSSMGDAVLVHELYKVQQEKNCLVVIDDIWTVDDWRNLCSAFPIGVPKCRSKILLTTRNENVAEVGSVYKLSGLTEKEGWQLISSKAHLVTEDSTEEVTAEMESIGRKMVMRCKGLPLAISTLGGMLRGKSLREWEIINKDISFYLTKGNRLDEYHTVTQVLGLSYDCLPPRLRQCFLCLANYKEDELIDVEQLYLFWLAEGFISSEDRAPGEMMLSVAERYLDELAHRSLVQIHRQEEQGLSWSKFKSCSVHDVIRDLCLSKVKAEKVIRIVDLQQKRDHDSEWRNDRIRRLCMRVYDSMDESSVDQNVIAYVRSLLLIKDNNKSYRLMETFFSLEKFKLLRVLAIKGFKLSEKSLRSTEKLGYLKYLSFNGCIVEELPSSIRNLRNLETLDLRVRFEKCRIPNILWKFGQLKHLYLPQYSSVYNNDQEKLRLNGLDELELIKGFHSKFCEARDIIELSKIQVFKGWIIFDEENPNVIESTTKFINSNKLYYSSLSIKLAAEVGDSVFLLFECPFIDSLYIDGRITALPKEYDLNRSSSRLTNLNLFGCEIKEFDPMMLLEKLVNLGSLILSSNSFTGRELVCSATGFPKLKKLGLIQLHNIESWIVNEGAMPNLSNLVIFNCIKLVMLPDGLKFLTALEHLEIPSMPDAFKDRVRIIDGVESLDFYKIRHVPNIVIDEL